MNDADLSAVPGLVAMVLPIAVALAYPVARLLLRRYKAKARVLSSTNSPVEGRPQASSELTPMAPSAFHGSAATLLQRLRKFPWLAAGVQASAAIAVAVDLAVLQLVVADSPIGFFGVLILAVTLLWPGVLAVMLTAGISPRERWSVLLLGFIGYFAVGTLVDTAPLSASIVHVASLWLILHLQPSLFLFIMMTRRVRAVGPFVLLVCLVTVGGAAAAQLLLQEEADRILRMVGVLFQWGFGPIFVFVAFHLVGAVLALGVGVLLLRMLAEAYSRNRISELGATLSALWLTFIVHFSSYQMLPSGAWYLLLGLTSFILYLAVVWILRRFLFRAPTSSAPALLLLRVFSDRGPTQDVFHAISRHWRYVGPVWMIAGADLAEAAIEPDMILKFVRHKLSDSFIKNPANALRTLSTEIPRRAPDGRFRNLQRFCYKDTWEPMMRGLVPGSAVILMDLRRFKKEGRKNEGVTTELAALAKLEAFGRTLILCDEESERVINEALTRLEIDRAPLHVLRLQTNASADIRLLLQKLSDRCLVTN